MDVLEFRLEYDPAALQIWVFQHNIKLQPSGFSLVADRCATGQISQMDPLPLPSINPNLINFTFGVRKRF